MPTSRIVALVMALLVPAAALGSFCDLRAADQRYGSACAQRHPIASTDYTACICDALERGSTPDLASGRRVDPDWLEGRLTARYGERCQLAGYSPGTGAFGQCLLVYADRDEAAQARADAQRRALLLQLYGQQQAQFAHQQAARDVQTRALQQRLLTVPAPGAICTTVEGNQIVSRPCY
jgi:hypothetical protein